MPQKIYEVTAPNGKVFEVEGDRPPTEAELTDIFSKMGAASSQIETAPAPVSPRWSDRMGLNEGTDSMPVGFMRGAASGAVDMAQGAAGALMRKLQSAQQANAGMERVSAKVVPQIQDEDIPADPGTFSATVGSALPTMGEMAMGPARVADDVIAAIPRTARAGAKFKEVMGVAGNMPVDVQAPLAAAARISELASHGGSLPKPVRDFIKLTTGVNKAGPANPGMTYRVARDFASNLSRLSANEIQKTPPAMLREVATMSAELNKAIAVTAKQAGKLDEYQSAMKEYAKAIRLRKAATVAAKGAAGALGVGAAGALGMKVLGELQ